MDILTVVFGVLTLSFAIAYSASVYRNKKMTEAFAKLLVSQTLLEEYFNSRNPETRKADEDIHKENFIKFLSDSREWAYQYIEDIQAGLNSFIKEVEPAIKYFNSYGIVTEGMPHYRDMKKISEEFEKLKRFLPEAVDDRR